MSSTTRSATSCSTNVTKPKPRGRPVCRSRMTTCSEGTGRWAAGDPRLTSARTPRCARTHRLYDISVSAIVISQLLCRQGRRERGCRSPTTGARLPSPPAHLRLCPSSAPLGKALQAHPPCKHASNRIQAAWGPWCAGEARSSAAGRPPCEGSAGARLLLGRHCWTPAPHCGDPSN